MGKNDDLLDDQTDGEDDIFELSLDDLSPEDIDQASANGRTDSEIIELMELVEKGEKDLEESDEEITLSYEEDDQPTKDLRDAAHTVNALSDGRKESQEEVSLSETDMALANISLESDISLLEGNESNMGVRGENIAEDKIQTKPPAKTEGKKILQQQDIVRKRKGDHTQPPVKEMTAISEEKIEVIVKRVVEDVVERVARETMAEVAERVIKEAIDALKQSLEKDPE
jgi:hypothetical protein